MRLSVHHLLFIVLSFENMLWKNQPTLEALNMMSQNTAVSHLGIEIIEFGDDYIKGRMPVDARTVQPFRLLHGGVSCVLAESLGSIASTLCIDLNKKRAVGVEINANHLRSASEGSFVIGTVRPIKVGRTMHIWSIDIHDENQRHICTSRLTIAVIDA